MTASTPNPPREKPVTGNDLESKMFFNGTHILKLKIKKKVKFDSLNTYFLFKQPFCSASLLNFNVQFTSENRNDDKA